MIVIRLAIKLAAFDPINRHRRLFNQWLSVEIIIKVLWLIANVASYNVTWVLMGSLEGTKFSGLLHIIFGLRIGNHSGFDSRIDLPIFKLLREDEMCARMWNASKNGMPKPLMVTWGIYELIHWVGAYVRRQHSCPLALWTLDLVRDLLKRDDQPIWYIASQYEYPNLTWWSRMFNFRSCLAWSICPLWNMPLF